MVPEGFVETIDFKLKRGAWKSEEKHSGVFQSLMKDQFPKIPIRNDKDACLLSGNRQDDLVSKTVRILPRDSGNVVTKTSKIVDEAKISALVKEKPHRPVMSE